MDGGMSLIAPKKWCAREDLNLHPLRDQILSLACLPFHHSRNALLPEHLKTICRWVGRSLVNICTPELNTDNVLTLQSYQADCLRESVGK